MASLYKEAGRFTAATRTADVFPEGVVYQSTPGRVTTKKQKTRLRACDR